MTNEKLKTWKVYLADHLKEPNNEIVGEVKFDAKNVNEFNEMLMDYLKDSPWLKPIRIEVN